MHNFHRIVDETGRVLIKKYIQSLMKYNKKVNIISRKITSGGLNKLLNETILLNSYISSDNNRIIDAGSGNGILGIPIAIINKEKKIVLVEPKRKKIIFLNEIKTVMDLSNVEVYGISIDEYFKKQKDKFKSSSLIARGFPDLSMFCNYIRKGIVEEVVLITSKNKIKKNKKHMENIRKKTYNVPLRIYLKILKMEKMVREEEKER